MNRRDFIAFVAGGAIGCPLAAMAQPVKAARIGMLGSTPGTNPIMDGFQNGLRELGYVEGVNIFLEHRSAEGDIARYRVLALELVNLKVDVIVAPGTPEALAAKEATSTIPIITFLASDPVGSGLVMSLARPGGNITGMSSAGTDTMAKQLELLKDMSPQTSKVAVLWDAAVGSHVNQLKELDVAARTLQVRLLPIELKTPEQTESALAEIKRQNVEALVTMDGPAAFLQRHRIADFAIQHRLPSIVAQRLYPEAGVLMSYGANRADLARRAATYVDKILKGTKPADLPIEQPTKFELVINLKTARALGLTIPPTLLARADEVIE